MAYKRNELNVEQLEALVRGRGKKFVSLKEGADLYSLGLHSFREIAKAIYKIKSRVLVNTEKVDEFLEVFALDDD